MREVFCHHFLEVSDKAQGIRQLRGRQGVQYQPVPVRGKVKQRAVEKPEEE